MEGNEGGVHMALGITILTPIYCAILFVIPIENSMCIYNIKKSITNYSLRIIIGEEKPILY